MLKNYKQRKQEGFTIIEVLIVLAIAGLIMMVVFLAVPSLQRNSRNTQRKNDVANLMSLAAEYTSNNNGKINFDGPALTAEAKLGYYDATSITTATFASGITAPTVDAVKIYTGAKCGANTTDDPVQGTTRQYAAFFAVEKQSGNTKQCQGL